MSDQFFSSMYCICCFGCVLFLNTVLLGFSFLFYNLTHIHELVWTFCQGVYYFLVCLFNLFLFGLIIKKSFDHVDKIISLKINGNMSAGILNDTKEIFYHILLNLIFLLKSVFLNLYFDYAIIKIPLVLYICWTLGFTASLRLNKELCMKLDNNQIKDYLLMKSIINTFIFLSIYLLKIYFN
jgi:hypothetical protein